MLVVVGDDFIMVDSLVLEYWLIMVNNEGNRLPYESEKPCIDSLLNDV